MYKRIFIPFLILLVVLAFSACQQTDNLQTVRLNEVVRSIFYAPQYVALQQGFFEEEGLKIELSTGWGADKTMTAILSDNADIGLLGAEATFYVYTEGKEDYVINFAQLTQRAGNFLVAREPIDNFTWDMVIGKTIVGGRPGGMPEMVLEYILKQNGITPFEDVTIINNIDYTATAGAFAGGTGDFTVEFEPAASTLELQGDFYVVASLGVDSGYLPYTTYAAKGSYIDKNPEVIQKFTNAIYKAQQWVDTHTAVEIAEVIQPYFEDTDIALLTKIVDRYKEQDTYKTTPLLEKDHYDLLQDVLESAGELSNPVDYDLLVTTKFAEEAVK